MHVPTFLSRQVFVNLDPAWMTVLSGMVTSVTKAARSMQPRSGWICNVLSTFSASSMQCESSGEYASKLRANRDPEVYMAWLLFPKAILLNVTSPKVISVVSGHPPDMHISFPPNSAIKQCFNVLWVSLSDSIIHSSFGY